MTTFDRLRTAAAENLHRVPVPEWGGETIAFRKYGGPEHWLCESLRERLRSEVPPEHRQTNLADAPLEVRELRTRHAVRYFAAIVAATAIDDDFQPLFDSPEKVAFLERQDYELLVRLKDEVLTLSGLSNEPDEDDDESARSAADADPFGSRESDSATTTDGPATPASDDCSPGASSLSWEAGAT